MTHLWCYAPASTNGHIRQFQYDHLNQQTAENWMTAAVTVGNPGYGGLAGAAMPGPAVNGVNGFAGPATLYWTATSLDPNDLAASSGSLAVSANGQVQCFRWPSRACKSWAMAATASP